ncbi:hypothetical protein [Woodsholea maritima]|uniref:hypothetical protein n=1 Tax=Woodsholea maritima TaxID=240237 RepID=UPI00036E5971|nr:hypothetical protein [Woodsholea maritima]
MTARGLILFQIIFALVWAFALIMVAQFFSSDVVNWLLVGYVLTNGLGTAFFARQQSEAKACEDA